MYRPGRRHLSHRKGPNLNKRQPQPVFFLSDGTGITAETLGNTLLTQFPDHAFDRTTIPFISSTRQACEIVDMVDALAAAGRDPIIFSTAVNAEIRSILSLSKASALIDLFGSHINELEAALKVRASGEPGRAHGFGNIMRYQLRMAAIEYAIEHDDGQSIRALEKAEVILIAPSRCGKTPTTMYLALQHGIAAANFPLIDEDFDRRQFPPPLVPYVDKCFGLTSNATRLSQIRQERRPGSKYASLQQCAYELRNAEEMYNLHRIPHLNSAAMSVEEISATVLQLLHLHH